jgi:hypothetical protein
MGVNVLLTTVGGKVSPSIVKSLTDIEERDLTVVVTDPVATVPGKYMVDEFYRTTASFEDADGFLADVMDIIAAEDIDLVIPCINEESLVLSERRERVESTGATLVTPAASLAAVTSGASAGATAARRARSWRDDDQADSRDPDRQPDRPPSPPAG